MARHQQDMDSLHLPDKCAFCGRRLDSAVIKHVEGLDPNFACPYCKQPVVLVTINHPINGRNVT